MSIASSARHFVQHVRQDGWSSIPPLLYIRWMTLRLHNDLRREQALRIAEEEQYQSWLHAQEPDSAERARQAAQPFRHRLSILIPTYNTRPELLEALADSLLCQTSPYWEACIYDGASTNAATRQCLESLAQRDKRFKVQLGKENLHISGNTNRALAMATGDYAALMDHDDLLAPDAVYHVLLSAEQGADMIYSDEDKCSEDGTRFFEPHLKADFAPDTLRAGNYICHLMAMKTELMRRLGGLRSAFDGSQDHDLALRASEQAEKIVHLPRILYHWRMLNTSVSHQGAEKCANAASAAVDDQLRRLGLKGHATMKELRVRIDYDIPTEPCVSLIILGDGTPLKPYLRRLSRSKPCHLKEIIILGESDERISIGGLTARFLPRKGTLSEDMNRAAGQAQGDYVLFLAQGLVPHLRKEDWVGEMLMYAQRPDVGCVGSAIITKKTMYLHAGYAVDVPGGAISHQTGAFFYSHPYMITDRLVRNVTGVSSGLMLLRRELFLSLGGFDAYESDLRGAALGLKCLEHGLLNVFTPHARMVCRADTPPCLTSPAPNGDLSLLHREHGEHPPEHYYSPLFEKRYGSMFLCMDAQEGVAP